MANAEDDRILYEHLDLITDALTRTPVGGDGYAEDVMREVLMRVMGLVWQSCSPRNDVPLGAPVPAGSYTVDPDMRDRSTAVMRRWLIDHGFLSRH